MRRHQPHNLYRQMRRQHGAALMVMMVILVLGATAFLLTALNRPHNAYIRASTNGTTNTALQEAKAALIGYAIQDVNRPGELPCPDINDDGMLVMNEDYIGNNCVNLLGRLPWKTLNLPRLTDESGETLWNAVSDAYHANGAMPLNSDTPGAISISGSLAASGVVALVIAAGQPLPGQDRGTGNRNAYPHFLESVATAPTHFAVQPPNDRSGGAYTFNDQVAMIQREDFMPNVEKVVAKKLQSDLPAFLESYRGQWLAYPFAMPFTDPTTPVLTGTPGISYGLMPMTAGTPTWNAVPTFSMDGGSASCSLRSATGSCSGSNCISARCSSITGTSPDKLITITGRINNVGMGFWRLYDQAAGTDNQASCTQEICVRNAADSRYYPASTAFNNVSITGLLNTDGSADISFQGTVKVGFTPNHVQFRPAGLPALSAPAWFADNQWYRTLYYAVSPEFLPSGSGACSPGSTCLTVKDTSGTRDDVRLLGVLMSQPLASQVHPSSTLANYLEGSNLTPASGVFETRTRAANFNDLVFPLVP